jgi:hypothetical protein
MDTLKDDKIKDIIKEFIHTIAEILYNDVFFYICIIAIYSISSFIIILAILYSCFFNHPRMRYNCDRCSII